MPADVGPVELSQHFVEFGKIVDMRLRAAVAGDGGKGEKEALIQFASSRQAQVCVSVSLYAWDIFSAVPVQKVTFVFVPFCLFFRFVARDVV